MKKSLLFTLIIIVLIVFAFWAPWLNWNLSIGQFIGLGKKENYSGLRVNSLLGEIDVYLNNEFKGSTKSDDGSGFELLNINPGKHKVSLKRKSNPDLAYFEFSKDITFEKGIDVVISYELGPTKKFSEGHVFYAEKSYESALEPRLSIIVSPDDAKIYIDDVFIGTSPLSNINTDLTKQHKVKVEKEGYDTISFDIFPSTQDDRNKLKGYDLFLDINLFLVPLDVEKNGEN